MCGSSIELVTLGSDSVSLFLFFFLFAFVLGCEMPRLFQHVSSLFIYLFLINSLFTLMLCLGI